MKTPTTYQGGKTRIAKKIVNAILNDANTEDFYLYDLCCGSGAITLEFYDQLGEFGFTTMLDWSPWGDFWKSIGEGWFSFDLFAKEIEQIPSDKDKIRAYLESLSKHQPLESINHHIYIFLLLQAGSFGGKSIWIDNGRWQNCSFRNYWQPTETSNRRSPVNPMMPMPDEIYRRVEEISANLSFMVSGIRRDIQSFRNIKKNSIVYIDPPYNNSTGYGNNFDVLKEVGRIKNIGAKKVYLSYGEKVSDKAILISEKRSKGNISGSNSAGVQEWLNIF
jgi:site-specific DNA-adenine methylase